MNAPPSVRPARGDEVETVADVLSDAFVDEAGLNYWLRQGARKTRARRRFFSAAVRAAVHPKRDLYLAQDNGENLGAAIWLAPGFHAYDFSLWQEIALTPLLLDIAGLGGMQRGLRLGKEIARHHPAEPHAHLVFLGVSPAAQGRGIGSAMLKETLAPLDGAGVTAFLETTTARNIALYERHGFLVNGEINEPGLTLWTMVRAPRV